jgi:site-specific DNA-methyltransferase (adenine-specific)/adenine-specific DNA-methyltransferase
VPYQVIKELHKVQFKKLRQPQKKEGVNDLDESIGFHFVRPPEVKAELKTNGEAVSLEITDFKISGDASGEVSGFEGLAMVLLDFNSNGKEFVMDEYYFTSDLVKAGENDDLQEKIKINKKLSIDLTGKSLGEKVIVIYIDIYGNEFRQPFNLN